MPDFKVSTWRQGNTKDSTKRLYIDIFLNWETDSLGHLSMLPSGSSRPLENNQQLLGSNCAAAAVGCRCVCAETPSAITVNRPEAKSAALARKTNAPHLNIRRPSTAPIPPFAPWPPQHVSAAAEILVFRWVVLSLLRPAGTTRRDPWADCAWVTFWGY